MRRLSLASILITILSCEAGRNVFVSSPFDNFRIECTKRSAAVELAVSMVQSAGGKRQDVVFEMSCENAQELYPWVNMPEGIREIEKEDCYYSPMFDPILSGVNEYSCTNREYVAGIARLTDTRIQIMCCRLRSRIEFNCEEFNFMKPINPTRTIIEHDNQIINAIRIEEESFVVRFCDLAPRSYEDIMIDVKTAETKKSQKKQKSAPLVSNIMTQVGGNAEMSSLTNNRQKNETKLSYGNDKKKLKPINGSIISSLPTLAKKTVITSTILPSTTTEAVTSTTTTSTTSVTTTITPRSTSTATAAITTTTAKPTTTVKFSSTTTTASTTKTPTTSTTTTTTTTTQPPVQTTTSPISTTPRTTTERTKQSEEDLTINSSEISKVTFNNDDFPSLVQTKKNSSNKKIVFSKTKKQKLDSSEFIFLHPINSNARRRAPVRPYITLWSNEEDENDDAEFAEQQVPTKKIRVIRRKATRAHTPEVSTSMVPNTDVPLATVWQDRTVLSDRSDFVKSRIESSNSDAEPVDNARFIDEETGGSPFDYKMERLGNINIDSTIGSGPTLEDLLYAKTLPIDLNEESLLPEMKTSSSNSNSVKQHETETADTELKMTPFTEATTSSTNLPAAQTSDPVTTEKPLEEQNVTRASLQIFRQRTTTEPYNAAQFYHTLKKKIVVKEKCKKTISFDLYLKDIDLTFCTKDVALRDDRNMVLACGGEFDIWLPKRCPEGTDCFLSKDSTYRICCPVAKG